MKFLPLVILFGALIVNDVYYRANIDELKNSLYNASIENDNLKYSLGQCKLLINQ
jgi:hypothetical protein